MSIVKGSPFKIDWTSKEAVIAYAKKLGPGQVVFKHPDRSNYNITHIGGCSPKWIIYEVTETDGRLW